MQLIKFSSLTDAQNAVIAKLIDYKVEYNKLWSTDTGRSMTGEFSGTLIGIFPKIVLTIRAYRNNMYYKTADTSVQSGKTYYSKSGNTYSVVGNPTKSGLSSYYELVTARQAENILLTILNADYNNVTYFDPYKNTNRTAQFYFGDVTAEVTKAVTSSLKYGQTSVELVATKKIT